MIRWFVETYKPFALMVLFILSCVVGLSILFITIFIVLFGVFAALVWRLSEGDIVGSTLIFLVMPILTRYIAKSEALMREKGVP